MIYTLTREGGIDFSPILADLKARQLPVLDSEALHQEQLKIVGDQQKLLEHFGEHSPRFRDLWGVHKDYYLSFLRLSIYRFAIEDGGIIYGHGASFILAQLPGTLKIKLAAPEDYRVKLVAEKENISEHEARTLVHKLERERSGFHHFFFDADWNDEACYDVIINIHSENYTDILHTMFEIQYPQSQIEERRRMLNNLIIAEELYMKLLFDEKLFIDLLKIQVSQEKKTIRIHGIIGDPKTQDKATTHIKEQYPDYQLEVNLELMQSSYLYFPSV